MGHVHLPVKGRGIAGVLLGLEQGPLETTNSGLSTVMIISDVARSLG